MVFLFIHFFEMLRGLCVSLCVCVRVCVYLCVCVCVLNLSDSLLFLYYFVGKCLGLSQEINAMKSYYYHKISCLFELPLQG